MRGISPIISTVLLVAIVLLMAVVVGPWALKLALEASGGATQDVERDLLCRQTSYAFDSDYGNSGVTWAANQTNGTVSAKITNTGSQNLYGFSFEMAMQTPTGLRLVIYPSVNITNETQRTKANPLKPGYDWIIEADVININDTWSLTEVKLINDVCPKVSPSVKF